MEGFVEQEIQRVRQQVGVGRVVCGLSGGVGLGCLLRRCCTGRLASV